MVEEERMNVKKFFVTLFIILGLAIILLQILGYQKEDYYMPLLLGGVSVELANLIAGAD